MIALAKIRRQRNWSEEEVNYLRSDTGRQLVAEKRYEELAKILQRPDRSIKSKLLRMELNPLSVHNKEAAVPAAECEIEFEPTDAFPGSNAKINVLSNRLFHGLPLWHPEDRCDYEGLMGGFKRRS